MALWSINVIMDYDKKYHRNVEVGIKLAQPLGYHDYVNLHNKRWKHIEREKYDIM
jgi:hypothetical protein